MHNLSEILYQHRDNHNVAIVQEKCSICYNELNNKCEMIAGILCKEDSTAIGIYMQNSIDFLVSFFGILYADKIVIPINYQLKCAEIQRIKNACRMKTIVALSKDRERLKSLDSQIHIIFLDEIPLRKANLNSDIRNLKNEKCMFFTTSGTTGETKLVEYSHKNLFEGTKKIQEAMNFNENTTDLIIVSMCTAFVMFEQVLLDIYAGAKIVIYEGMIRTNKLFNIIQKESVTTLAAVPSLLELLLESYCSEKHDISSIKLFRIAGEKAKKELYHTIIQTFGWIKLIQIYGMTESSLARFGYDDWNYKIGAVGRAMPGVKFYIWDSKNACCEPNVAGEVVFCSKYIMEGYYGKAERYDETSLFRTGDIGYMDEDGYLYILGRKKNVIISGGRNIYPEEVENVLCNYPLVQEARVYSKRHVISGEVVVADIVTKDSKLDQHMLVEYCKNCLASYKIPIEFFQVPEIEKTVTLKIKRY